MTRNHYIKLCSLQYTNQLITVHQQS